MIQIGKCKQGGLALLALLLMSSARVPAASNPWPVVPKWGRLDYSFTSSVIYSNPLQQATLKVQFLSPLGESARAAGFWDGGRTWRVRFSPNQPGRWTFRTICSDPGNRGLNNQTGEFTCTTVAGQNRFYLHGPIRVAPDHRHFEHEDGTRFFWLADTLWPLARVAEPKEVELYAQVRGSQGYTVVQWAAASGKDVQDESAVTGFPDRIGINPGYFKRLDAKLEHLTEEGLLSAIAPVPELDTQKEPGTGLAEDQAALLAQYVVARWGAEPVVWLVAFDTPVKAARWKKLGHALFGEIQHAPVIVLSAGTNAPLEEFRAANWVDGFGFQNIPEVSDAGLKWVFAGPLAAEWNEQPARPVCFFPPYENGSVRPKKRFSSDDVRHAAYWGLLISPAAGISYGGQGVENWDPTVQPAADKTPGANLPLWEKSLFMPAAKQMGHLAKLMNSLEYWRLRPAPQLIAAQPGQQSVQRQVVAASTETKDLSLVYIPEDRTLELVMNQLPPSPKVTWFNPRTGASTPAVAVVAGNACQFSTPGQGDWVLLVKASQK